MRFCPFFITITCRFYILNKVKKLRNYGKFGFIDVTEAKITDFLLSVIRTPLPALK